MYTRRKILKDAKKSSNPLFGLDEMLVLENRGELDRKKTLFQKLFSKKEPELSPYLQNLYQRYESMNLSEEERSGVEGVFRVLKMFQKDQELVGLDRENLRCLQPLDVGLNLIYGPNGKVSLFDFDELGSYPDSYRVTHFKATIQERYQAGVISTLTLRRAILQYITSFNNPNQ